MLVALLQRKGNRHSSLIWKVKGIMTINKMVNFGKFLYMSMYASNDRLIRVTCNGPGNTIIKNKILLTCNKAIHSLHWRETGKGKRFLQKYILHFINSFLRYCFIWNKLSHHFRINSAKELANLQDKLNLGQTFEARLLLKRLLLCSFSYGEIWPSSLALI